MSNIQRYSIQDGPGIRTTVFLKGCPLKCWWCHNPEMRSPEPEIIVIETRCIRCGECERHPDAGVQACPTGARQAAGTRMTVVEVLAEITKDSIFYDDSGGGVTFSGGEPLMQPKFLKTLLDECRSRGIRTAVDTCGYAPHEAIAAVAPSTDLFLYDLKMMNDALHRKYTGVSNRLILENLEWLARAHDTIWIRLPVIPGVNDAELESLARFTSSLPGIRQVNLLPYHATGIPKFRRLGQDYELSETRPPTAEFMESAVRIFRACGLKAKVGG